MGLRDVFRRIARLGRSIVDRIKGAVRDHYDAFSVEAFGPGNLPQERIDDLANRGVLDPDQRVTVQVGEQQVTPFEFLQHVREHLDAADPDTQADMRTWPLDRWVEHVKPEPVSGPAPVPDAVPASAPGGPSDAERGAMDAAEESAGDFCRGLGNAIADELEDTAAEVWDGEDIVEEVDEEKRAERVRLIRELTAQAITEGWDARRLASELGHAIGDWQHGLLRIARTELQAAYNEGRVRDAAKSGSNVARVPETGACDACLSLFLGRGGRPRVFSVSDLVANGTNVGKPRDQWQPTVYPVHPNCRCDTVVVPPGMIVTSDGRLRREATHAGTDS